MAFLTNDDYKPQIRDWIKNIVINEDPNIQSKIEIAAQEEMESYLRDRYNVGEIFEAVGNDRNGLIVMYMVDIALYHLHSNISPENIPELRYTRYNAAIDWLKAVAKGNLSPNLPEYSSDPDSEDPESDSIFFQGGSNDVVSERY